LLSAEGILVGIQRCTIESALADPFAYQAAIEIVVKITSDPSILGMANLSERKLVQPGILLRA
jgi:hypothetical protein